MPLTTGQVLNARYRIVALLGQGGFGAVYRAWDLTLKTPCAVKENFDTTPEAVRQFEREANFLATLHHPSLPRVIDHFTVPGQGQYLVMDFIEGQDLETLCQQASGPLAETDILNWITQICSALSYMHTQPNPIIHRDIKPANIIIRPDGRAVLVDFGIAKIYQAGGHTTIGARGITPGYSPPEQYGQGHTDLRTDIYALGATAYMLLTRRDPPESLDLLRGAAHLISLRTLTPKASPHLVAAIERAMQLNPEQRFASAAEFHSALSSPDKITRIPPTTKKSFPWGWVAAGAGFSFVILAVIAIGIYIFIIKPGPAVVTPTVSHAEITEGVGSNVTTHTSQGDENTQPSDSPTLTPPPSDMNNDTPEATPKDPSISQFSVASISIWPEHDQPGVLVIYRFTHTSETSLPVDLTIHIPASCEPYALAGRQSDGTLYNIDYTQDTSREWTDINFSNAFPEIQLECYDYSLQIDDTQRHFDFFWVADYAVDDLSIQVQQPVEATDLHVSPDFGAGVTANDGMVYYTRQVGQTNAGGTIEVSLNYQIQTAEPTIPSLPVSLAYVRGPIGDTNISITNSTGSTTSCVACNSCDESDPAFSPNGQYLIYQSNCGGSYDIWRTYVSGGSAAQLTSTSNYDEREPHYSPDGSTIIYQRLPSNESRNTAGEIWVMDANGSNNRSLGLIGRNPVYSPDGHSIAYMSDTSGRWQIYIYSFDNHTSRQLTSCSTNCRWPDWSPDGRFVIYNTTVSVTNMDPAGIEYIPVDGGAPTVLIHDETCGRPAWSNSGWIAFNSPRGIEIIQPDSTNRTVLVNITDAWGPAYSR